MTALLRKLTAFRQRAASIVTRSLSAKLTLFYASLFALAAAIILFGAQRGISAYAEHMVTSEMESGSKVFDRVAAMRYDKLADASGVLAADFGFRSAIATGDAPTIASALDSLRSRLGLSQAFFVGTEGNVVGLRGTITDKESATLLASLESDAARGVLVLGDARFNAAAAPVKVPVTVGWVVFANALDAREIANLASLSAIGLQPRIVPVSQLPAGVTTSGAPSERNVGGERILAQARPLESFDAGAPQALLLEYSVTGALAAYTPMLWLLAACGLIGVALAGVGSFFLARRLTKPIAALSAAARRVSQGEYAQVAVQTSDELGTLATSFNKSGIL